MVLLHKSKVVKRLGVSPCRLSSQQSIILPCFCRYEIVLGFARTLEALDLHDVVACHGICHIKDPYLSFAVSNQINSIEFRTNFKYIKKRFPNPAFRGGINVVKL